MNCVETPSEKVFSLSMKRVEVKEVKRDAARHAEIPVYTPLVLPGPPGPSPAADYKLQVAPQFTATPKDKRVPAGASLHLHCSVTGVPHPRVRWLKDGKEISTGKDYNIKNVCGLLTLEVLDVSSQHGGVYTCQAINEHGTSSCDATVTVEGEEAVKTIQVEILRPRFLTPLEDLAVNEGDDVTMSCVATGNPIPTLKWQKDMLELTSTSRVSVRSDGQGGSTLTILRVRPSDAGLYIVRAKSRSGRCQTTSTLRVRAGTRPPSPPSHASRQPRTEYCMGTNLRHKVQGETPPSFSLRLPHCLDMHEGDNLRLDCSVQGYPKPIVTWYKNYRALRYGPRHRILFVGSLHTLHIPQIMELDSGDYIVRACNNSGSVEAVCSVRLLPARQSTGRISPVKPSQTYESQRIRTAPFFTKTLPSTVEVSEGGNFRLDTVTREGIELVPWVQHQDIDPPYPAASPLTEDTQQRPLGGARLDSSAGQSSQGTEADGASTRMQEALPETLEVEVGQTVTLTCTVSQPFARITWYKDGELMSFKSQRVSSLRESGGRVSLRVEGVQDSDVGLYRCVAVLTDGTQLQSHTRLCVRGQGASQVDNDTRQAVCTAAEEMASSAERGQEPPPLVIPQQKQQMAEEGGSVIFRVTVSSSSPVQVKWNHGGLQLEPGAKYKMFEEDGEYYLEICDVSTEDKGTYSVHVTNNAGTESQLLILDIPDRQELQPPTLISPLQDVDAVIGDCNVRLKCKVAAMTESEGSVTWYHDGKMLEEAEEEGYRSGWTGNEASLIIRKVKPRHAGLYRCLIENSGGQITSTGALAVREPEQLQPPSFVRELHDMDVEDGDSVEMIVEIRDTDPDKAAET